MSRDAAIEDLQIRLAYQQRSLDELSELGYAQQREIERLAERCRVLEARVQTLAEGGDDAADDAPPPHY